MKRSEFVTEAYYKLSDVFPEIKTGGDKKELVLCILDTLDAKAEAAGFREAGIFIPGMKKDEVKAALKWYREEQKHAGEPT